MTGTKFADEQDPHVSNAHLKLELRIADGETTSPTIIATVTNLHESTTLTLLRWDTPYDEKALLLGLFTIKDLSSGEVIPSPGLKLNRKLPPPQDAFLEIPPRRAIAKEIVLDGPAAPLKKGTKYEIQAKGTWKAVWQASVKHIGYENLQKMGGSNGVVTLDFESNIIVLEPPVDTASDSGSTKSSKRLSSKRLVRSGSSFLKD